MRSVGSSLVLYLPKIQTAEEAALWNDILTALESHLGLPHGTIKTYVLVEQIEACFQLMEIRAALRIAVRRLQHRPVGLHQQRLRRDGLGSRLRQSEHRRDHDDLRLHAALRGSRAPRRATRPIALGRTVLWQGGMEPNIPVGSAAGVAASMARAVAGAEREQREGASGKWVAHWKMVHIVRPVWEKAGQDNQLGRQFPPLTYTAADAERLRALEPAAAHRARRARSDQRRAAVRQRVRPGHAGGGAQAGGLLRQRRRALPDGGHGHGRDPPEHPVGMAAQARGVHAPTTRAA